jgi:putative hydrolase of HD superfamily
MALTFANEAPPGVDMSRVVNMLLIHDIVEIDAGDTWIFAIESNKLPALAGKGNNLASVI